MNADHFKQALLALEEKLEEKPTSIEQPPTHHHARQLYFELQRLVHQYASIQIRVDSTKMS